MSLVFVDPIYQPGMEVFNWDVLMRDGSVARIMGCEQQQGRICLRGAFLLLTRQNIVGKGRFCCFCGIGRSNRYRPKSLACTGL